MNIAIIGTPYNRELCLSALKSSLKQKILRKLVVTHLEESVTAKDVHKKHVVKKFYEIILVKTSTATAGFIAKHLSDNFKKCPTIKGVELKLSDHTGTRAAAGMAFVTTMTLENLSQQKKN